MRPEVAARVNINEFNMLKMTKTAEQKTRGEWAVDSWQRYRVVQQPEYPDVEAYHSVLQKIHTFPPLVSIGEVEKLRAKIADASAGRAFVLQGGDCAERFIDCNEHMIANRLKILLQMSVILTYGIRMPIIKVGRIAGQYAKPRSKNNEHVNGLDIPSYRGDCVNSFEPDPLARVADPQRLLQSYYYSSMTLNYIRAMIDGGFADLHHPYHWNLHSIEQTKKWPAYRNVVDRILDAVNFMEAFGGTRPESLGKVDFYVSHEGLLLGYEEALTRKDPVSGRYYNLGAHTVWIGDRTRAIDGAHVEYFRGIANPVGIKVGPGCEADELLELLAVLNPKNEPGRIILITRFGINHVEQKLPQVVQAVQKAGFQVAWSCDPMHGNIISSNGNRKTRDFSDILTEFQHCFRIHKELESFLAGAHFELTGEDVTECIGGAVALKDDDLAKNYETYCDPRLNYAQSLEIAFLITQLFQENNA